jgi:hypothetical protein
MLTGIIYTGKQREGITTSFIGTLAINREQRLNNQTEKEQREGGG